MSEKLDVAEEYLGVTRAEIEPYLKYPWLEEWPAPRIRRAFVYYTLEAAERERKGGTLTPAYLNHLVNDFDWIQKLGLSSIDRDFQDARGDRPEEPDEE